MSALGPVRPVFRAIARTVVPEAGALDEDGWSRLEAVVEEGLSTRPPGMVRQIQLFIRAVEWMAVARHGRRFSALPEARRRDFLEGLERGPALMVRRGLWGVRTLAYMGYYTLPEVRAAIGYRAHPGGWRAREAAGP